MRIDRWMRLNIGKIPQGLIEKYLRIGKIKINKKKSKEFSISFIGHSHKNSHHTLIPCQKNVQNSLEWSCLLYKTAKYKYLSLSLLY